jgi:hypothetical protein
MEGEKIYAAGKQNVEIVVGNSYGLPQEASFSLSLFMYRLVCL